MLVIGNAHDLQGLPAGWAGSNLLKDVFQYIRIPLLCIYEDDIALDYLKAIDDAVKDAGIVSHTATLRDYYNSINTLEFSFLPTRWGAIDRSMDASKTLLKTVASDLSNSPRCAQ